jgi:hypothetical protein
MAKLVEIVKAAAQAWQQLVAAGFDPRHHENQELEPLDQLSAEAKAELEANPVELEAYKTCLEIEQMDAHVLGMMKMQRTAFLSACRSLLDVESLAQGAVYTLLRALLLALPTMDHEAGNDGLFRLLHEDVVKVVEDSSVSLRCRLLAIELASTIPGPENGEEGVDKRTLFC